MVIPVNALPTQKREKLKEILVKWVHSYMEKIMLLQTNNTHNIAFKWGNKRVEIEGGNSIERIRIFVMKKKDMWEEILFINVSTNTIKLQNWFDIYNFKQIVKKLKMILKELEGAWIEWKKKN
jgi:hypothetical protein